MTRTALRAAMSCALLAATILAAAEIPARPAHATSGGITSLNFPRLGNYAGYDYPALAPIYTRYGFLIAKESFTWDGSNAIQTLRVANPSATVLTRERTALLDYTNQSYYGSQGIYPGWWALKVGSTLAGSINSSQTNIPVVSSAPFHQYDDVLVDGESMHITAISGNTLTVLRGFYSTASSHSAGARIAPHASIPTGGPSLSNHDPINDPSQDRPWLLNLSSLCPRDSHGNRWVDFLASWIKNKILSAGIWDGVFFDNTNDVLYDNTIDTNNDNVGDGGVVNGVNYWQQGIAALYSEVRSAYPSAILMGTGPIFSQYAATNGQNFNATNILDPEHYTALVAQYHYHQTASVAPSFSEINVSTPSGPPSLQLMRFGLGTALLDNGVFTYDRAAIMNGMPWWFDEEDNGAGTALSAPAGASDTQLSVVHPGLFHVGDVVEDENELMQVTAVGTTHLTVTRAISGTRAAAHDAGTVIATPQQVQAGLGYLGQPTSAPWVIQASHTNLLANGSFDTGTYGPWYVNATAPAVGTLAIDPTTSVNGRYSALVVAVKLDSTGSGVEFEQQSVNIAGGNSYQLTFSAKSLLSHNLHVMICALNGNPECFVDATLGVRPQWTSYTLNFYAPYSTTDARMKFYVDGALTSTWFDAISLVQTPQPLLRRNFQYGTVLVNPGPGTATYPVSSGYCRLRGDQNPSLNNGGPAGTVTIPAQDAVILRTCKV